MNEQETIRLSVYGKDNKPIHFDELGLILRSYQQMLDRSYLACCGSQTIKRVKRDHFYVTVRSMQTGSALFDIVPYMAQGMFVFGVQAHEAVNPVVELMRQTMNFFRERQRLRNIHKKSPDVHVQQGIGNIGQVNVSGDNHITISPIIKVGADMSEGPVLQMTNLLKRGNVREIASSIKGDSLFTIGTEHAYMMHDADEYDDREESLAAKIRRFDTISGKGRLRVIESGSMSVDAEYTFMAPDALHDDIVDAMHKSVNRTSLIITKDYNRHPSGEMTIACLYIKDIDGE